MYRQVVELANVDVVRSALPARTDKALVVAAQRGQPAAFGQLYERHFDAIYRYLAFKVSNATDAEDLAAQVFLRALQALPKYRPTGVPFRSWLFRIAHNLMADHVRHRVRWATGSLSGDLNSAATLGGAPNAAADDPENAVAALETREELTAALERLTELQRQVIELKFAAGLSNPEVAAMLGKSVTAVKSVQHGALVTLHRLLRGTHRGTTASRPNAAA